MTVGALIMSAVMALMGSKHPIRWGYSGKVLAIK